MLLVEDSPADAELAERELQRTGRPLIAERVETRDAFLAALDAFVPDVILVDYRLPQFDGLSALGLARERGCTAPVIVFTGSLDEETAADCIKAGAADYVLKDRRARLVTAVNGALERARAEEALRQSEANYRALVEHVPFGIYQSRADGTFLAVNSALVSMLGYESREELMALDLPTDIYLSREDRALLMEQFRGVDRIRDVEVQWKRRDGSPITVRLNGRVVEMPNNGPCFEMAVEDVTERRALESQLRQAQKMEAIGQLTGGIAHDFNNELSVILLNAQLVADAAEAGEPVKVSDLRDIEDAARRASTMTRRLLGFSRQADLRMVPADLGRAVRNMRSVLKRLLPESMDIRINADTPARPVRVDIGAVEQMLLNLATNARDAMPLGGILSIGVKDVALDAAFCRQHPAVDPGDYVCITVRDSGTGMDERTRARVFEPFFTTKPPGAGTGLGLAMVYGLTKQQRGYITVESKTGRGTTVRIFFPALAKAMALANAQAPIATPRDDGLRGGTEIVLLVEDEDALRSAGRRVLERFGYQVITAADGEEALEIFRERSGEIDLILTDLVMPRMSGAQLYAAVRESLGTTRFVLASGYAARDASERKLMDPTVPFVQKPWRLDELLLTVRRVLDADGHPASLPTASGWTS